MKRLTFRKRRDAGSHTPAWSPDGRRIAFASNRVHLFNPELFVMNADGTRVRRLTFTRGADDVFGDDSTPHWSPDGTRIVFTSNRTNDGALWTIRPDGKGERMLYDVRDTYESHPRFSPDGRRIAFEREFADGSDEVWLIGSDGRGARKLVDGNAPSWRP